MSNAILIIEQMDFQSMENKILVETIMDKQVKNYWLIGPHAEGGIVNGNGRTYPVPVVAKEVKRLNEKEIPNKRMLGELSHPSTIDINYERVSHLTTELKMENKWTCRCRRNTSPRLFPSNTRWLVTSKVH